MNIQTIKSGDCELVVYGQPDIRKDQNGYFQIKRDGKWDYIHRVITGCPKGKVVYRTCDNPGCIAKEHLKVGTRQEARQHNIKRKDTYLDSSVRGLTMQYLTELAKHIGGRVVGDKVKHRGTVVAERYARTSDVVVFYKNSGVYHLCVVVKPETFKEALHYAVELLA